MSDGHQADIPAPRSQPAGGIDEDRRVQLQILAEQIAAVEHGSVESGPAHDRTADPVELGSQGPRSAEHVPDEHTPVEHSSVEHSSVEHSSVERRSEERTPAQLTAAARAICLRLLTIAPRPRAGLAQALKRKDIPDHIAEPVLDRLTQVGLIDDVAYAYSFVRVKHRDRALGRTALRTELRRLGVDEESMAGAVSTVDADAERARAQDLIAKRVDAAMGAGVVAARRRLLGLLGRRGYPPDIAISVVDGAIEGYADGRDDRA